MGLNVAELVSVFQPDPTAPSTAGVSISVAVIGLVSVFAALIPGLGGIISGTVGGAVGSAMFLSNAVEGLYKSRKDSEPVFTQFANISGDLRNFKDHVYDVLTAYFLQVFSDKPPTDGAAQGTDLANLLQDSVWADQDVVLRQRDRPSMIRVLESTVINDIWNSQQKALVKFKDSTFRDFESLTAYLSWSPCFG